MLTVPVTYRVVLEIIAIGKLVDRTVLEHVLRAFDGPPHSASFYAFFHQMTAGTLIVALQQVLLSEAPLPKSKIDLACC